MTKTASEMTVAEIVAELKRRNERFPVGDNFLLDLANRLADEPKAPQCGATVGETSGFSAAECALPAGHPGAHQWQPLNRGGDRG